MYESERNNEYLQENKKLKRLVYDLAMVIGQLKKLWMKEVIDSVNNRRNQLLYLECLK